MNTIIFKEYNYLHAVFELTGSRGSGSCGLLGSSDVGDRRGGWFGSGVLGEVNSGFTKVPCMG